PAGRTTEGPCSAHAPQSNRRARPGGSGGDAILLGLPRRPRSAGPRRTRPQLSRIERSPPERKVTGSNPVGRTNPRALRAPRLTVARVLVSAALDRTAHGARPRAYASEPAPGAERQAREQPQALGDGRVEAARQVLDVERRARV